MKIDSLKSLDMESLKKVLSEFRTEQFVLKMQVSNGQVKTTHRIREIRKNIARVKTILTEKQRG
ncbi:50S ribosomal protein L29 [Candidatus Berkiella cookevillensis]|uniref:Large ribosomal subunit protein uL29 n=1 Tax=Candidatus Berkiella cookevillensis TaxID=437022 RepID=A0A0Q9YEU3_9GAMM|nr:50S ribosomal protein L29 [Candidatus Berkiella cookevillensis]MCS5709386.1 50S ribosomal protein L29 [Candidatus Berkiella cookevillensis]